jgi:hypothetical protein
MGNLKRRRKLAPLVVFVGSGVHREIIGSGWERSPLASWETLLSTTAQRAGLPMGVACHKSLTAAWETMVLCGLCNGYKNATGSFVRPRRDAAATVDRALRKICSDVIEAAGICLRERYKTSAAIQSLSAIVAHREVHLVDLNFDMLICGALGVEGMPDGGDAPKSRNSGITNLEHEALFRNWQIPGSRGSRVWKPHGWVRKPDTLRLGLRDFGLQGAGYRWAFGLHKAEQKGSARSRPRISNTWIAKVMRCECRAIGLGLGPDEWGLHWLLTQRARERARKKPSLPFTVYRSSSKPLPIGVDCSEHPTWAGAIQAALEDR